MAFEVVVEGKVIGQRRLSFAGRAVDLPAVWQEPTVVLHLQDFIAHVVRREVDAFYERQQERHLLHVLAPADIQRGAEAGRVAMGGRDFDQRVDPQAAVETALRAFEDGVYFVFIDGEQQMTLDAVIPLQAGSRVTFLRLERVQPFKQVFRELYLLTRGGASGGDDLPSL